VNEHPHADLADLDLSPAQMQAMGQDVLTRSIAHLAALPQMRAQGHGAIVNTASNYGITGGATRTAYSASKAAIIGFTKSLALEIGSRNVTVNAIAPGFIKTSMTDAMTDDAKKNLEERIAARRLGTPDDIAYAAVFLASEQAGYITGTVLNVSGGLYM